MKKINMKMKIDVCNQDQAQNYNNITIKNKLCKLIYYNKKFKAIR